MVFRFICIVLNYTGMGWGREEYVRGSADTYRSQKRVPYSLELGLQMVVLCVCNRKQYVLLIAELEITNN